MQANLIKKGLLALSAALLFTALMLLHALRCGQAAMEQSDVAFNRGSLRTSLLAARDATRWDFPFAPHVASAHARLLAIATGAEASGNSELALQGWSALRSALIESAHPWSERSALQKQADAGVVRLLPRPSSVLEPAAAQAGVEDLQLTQQRPAAAFYAASGLGMLLLLAGAAALVVLRTRGQLGFAAVSLGAGLFLWIFAAIGA